MLYGGFRWSCISLAFFGASFLSAEESSQASDRERIAKAFEKIAEHQRGIADEVDHLRSYLGLESALKELSPLPVVEGMQERVKTPTQDGVKFFHESNFTQAKESFQQAWKEDPNQYTTLFNLGLVYDRLGNTSLAKKMLKSALEIKSDLPNADKIQVFLSEQPDKTEPLDSNAVFKAEAINLQKQAESTLSSTALSYSVKMRATVELLKQLESKADKNPEIAREQLLFVADTYAAFEMYESAVECFKKYEKSMEGSVLPDGYDAKHLQTVEKQKNQSIALSRYLGNKPVLPSGRKIQSNVDELMIFASQMDEFVQQCSARDADFNKITKRLGEYRWSNRAGRHVLVVSRYEELYYSSLAGTLPIGDYQDIKGEKPLRNITRLADVLKLKQVEFVETELSIHGAGSKMEQITYIVLYTYIPKLESFIIVRVPKSDLSSG